MSEPRCVPIEKREELVEYARLVELRLPDDPNPDYQPNDELEAILTDQNQWPGPDFFWAAFDRFQRCGRWRLLSEYRLLFDVDWKALAELCGKGWKLHEPFVPQLVGKCLGRRF